MCFMTKQLSKEIMKRWRLRLYNKQRNYCVPLLQKCKRGHYENLNMKNVTDNKLFCKSVEPLLSDKLRVRDRINIREILRVKS